MQILNEELNDKTANTCFTKQHNKVHRGFKV